MKIANQLHQLSQNMQSLMMTQQTNANLLNIISEILIENDLITREDFEKRFERDMLKFKAYMEARNERKLKGQLKTPEEERAFKEEFEQTFKEIQGSIQQKETSK